MLANDFCNIAFLNAAVESAFRVDDNNRAESTKAEAACLNNLYFLCETVLFDFAFES